MASSPKLRLDSNSDDRDLVKHTNKKRMLSELSLPEKDEGMKQKLREKNRTNSKRFRDRKKNHMDNLFEEKYRLGQENNELKETQEKLQTLLDEAIKENKLHKARQSLLLQTLNPSLDIQMEIRRQILPVSAETRAVATLKKSSSAPVSSVSVGACNSFKTTQIEDFVTLSRVPTTSRSPSYLGLLGDVQQQSVRQNQLFEVLSLQRFGLLGGKQPPIDDAVKQLSSLI